MSREGELWPRRYQHFPNLSASEGRYSLRPILWEDRQAIMGWRNSQIDVLRQDTPITQEAQDAYFSTVVKPQFALTNPSQILWGFLEDEALIGYGGLVHIQWADERAEVSFLTDSQRLDATTFASDWFTYLSMLSNLAFVRLGLHKLTTETYEIRSHLIKILEEFGFRREGIHRDHHRIDNSWMISYSHGLLTSDLKEPSDPR